MKLVYISGPYRDARGLHYVKENIRLAEHFARDIWKCEGLVAVCPHMNTAFLDGTDLADDKFILGDLEILRRCDAIAMVGAWNLSAGANMEIEEAKSLGLPVFLLPEEMSQLVEFGKTDVVDWRV